MDRLRELRENLDRQGVTTQLDVVSEAGHSDLAVIPTVLSFLSDQVAASATPRRRPPARS